MELATVLITGFEPFGKHAVNPSARIAHALDGRVIASARVTGVELPCSAMDTPPALQAALHDVNPNLVLLLGLAAGRSALALERVAINVMDFGLPDNAGAQMVDEPVVPGGPDAYFSTLPVRAILRAWRDAGIPGSLSNSAGTYVCNLAAYWASHLAAGNGFRAGLVHLPALPEQVAHDGGNLPSMSLDVIVRAIEIAVTVAVETQRDVRTPAGAV